MRDLKLCTGVNRGLNLKAAMLTTALVLIGMPAFAETPQAVAPQTAPVEAQASVSGAKLLSGAQMHVVLTPEFMKSAKQKYALSQTADASSDLGQAAVASPLTSAPPSLGTPSLSNPTPLARAALDQGAALYAASPLVQAATATTGAAVPTSCPGTYILPAKTANAVLGDAYDSISKRDIASLQAQLPGLQAALSSVPLKALAPEVCNDHVNFFNPAQFTKFSVLRDAGVASGVPANLPFVKQPELPFTALAFAIGWSKYELQDFDGAFLALAKGLIIDPSSYFLANEYTANLMQMKRYTDVVGFTETFLTNNYTLEDEQRSQLFSNHGWALIFLGYGDAAEKSFMVSLYYNADNKTAVEGLTVLRNAKAKAGAS